MDTNLYIKSFKTEGNKITDIKFNGDWEIEAGNAEGEVTKVTVKGLPDGLEAVLGSDDKLKIKNNGSSSYFVTRIFNSKFNVIGNLISNNFLDLIVRPGNTLNVTIPQDTKNYGERFVYVVIRPGDSTTTIGQGGIVAYLKAGIKNGTRYIEGV